MRVYVLALSKYLIAGDLMLFALLSVFLLRARIEAVRSGESDGYRAFSGVLGGVQIALIVIFMGDARNNKNDPMYDTVKNICHKVKRAFWLNTETVDEWDTADSLASGYGRYAKMFEVANMRELIGFIQEGIR